MSPPARGRGSKQPSRQTVREAPGRPPHGGVDRNFAAAGPNAGACVAPRTGAWIETVRMLQGVVSVRVAPRTGAWIETLSMLLCSERRRVAPRTGAWIETRTWCVIMPKISVAPRTGAWIETLESVARLIGDRVAPRTGAWIETQTAASPDHAPDVAPRTGAWIETMTPWNGSTRNGSPPARGRGSKLWLRPEYQIPRCRPPHGGVDRNTAWWQSDDGKKVAPRTGAWIETAI